MNYTDFSKNMTEVNDPVVKVHEEIMKDFTKPEITESIVKEVIGIVSGCKKLNLRKEADKDSKVLNILKEGTELVIEQEESTEDFYKVICKDGKAGYCMKKYITIK